MNTRSARLKTVSELVADRLLVPIELKALKNRVKALEEQLKAAPTDGAYKSSGGDAPAEAEEEVDDKDEM